ncbi:class I SAM-dependent methyltransferase [Brevibacillus humidisoli]|uniref:class I SAM-dependent methyltransferase n=1 Tax=Brevibacillus humidisoli TaxID=2895522 RepID=UPI001E50FDFB|nr:class I SAM-dependent methyltransferase [Brevibacillus humidisoli]UFJ42409.1 class I SAM-dependent methyltransferase [Brevibacillus humidisoli]
MNEVERAASLFNSLYQRADEYVSDYTAHVIFHCLERGGVRFHPEGVTILQILNRLGCVQQMKPVVCWAIGYLLQQNMLLLSGDKLYRGPAAYQFREDHELTGSVIVQPSLQLIQFAGRHWLDLVAGRIDPQWLAATIKQKRLWQAYYSNRHDLYAVYNQWAAEVFAERVDLEGTHLIEVGVGYGSASFALLAECALRGVDITGYTLEDNDPILLEQTQKRLQNRFGAISFQSRLADLNQLHWVAPERFDHVFAVNGMVCTRDLTVTAQRLHSLVKPGGAVLLSQWVRPNDCGKRHEEFIFSLLPGVRPFQSETDLSVCFAFFTTEDWRSAFLNAGFRQVEVYVNPGEKSKAAIVKGLH